MQQQSFKQKRYIRIILSAGLIIFAVSTALAFVTPSDRAFFPLIPAVYAAPGDQIFVVQTQITKINEEVTKAAAATQGAANAAAAKTEAMKALGKAKEAINSGDSMASAAMSAAESIKSTKPAEAQKLIIAAEGYKAQITNLGQTVSAQEGPINSGDITPIKDAADTLAKTILELKVQTEQVVGIAIEAGFKPPAGAIGGTSTATPASSKPGQTFNLYNPIGITSIPTLAGKIINMFLGIVGALALLVFVYAGIIYMTAGSSDRVKKAQDTLKYAVLGLFIIMFSYTMTDQFIQLWTTRYVPAEEPVAARTSGAGPSAADQETTSLEEQAQKEKEAEAAAAKAAAESAQQDPKACLTQKLSDGTTKVIRRCKVPGSTEEAKTCWASGCSGSELCCPI